MEVRRSVYLFVYEPDLDDFPAWWSLKTCMELGARVAPGPCHRVRPTRPPIFTAALRLADSK